MDQLGNDAAPDGEEKPRDARPPATDDLSTLAAALPIEDLPVSLAAAFLIPFIAYALLTFIWPLLCWLAKWLDYRRYMNGGVW